MPTSMNDQSRESIVSELVSELETDFPTVACDAAIELDKLSLDGETDLSAVHELVRRIKESIPDEQQLPPASSLINSPTKAVVFWSAISDSLDQNLTKIDELVSEARKIAQCLSKLLDDPESFKNSCPKDVQRMSSFCLALSKRASASKRARKETKPENPYRR